MSIHGIEQYPELAKKLQMELSDAARRPGCGRCNKRQVLEKFRRLLEARRAAERTR